MRDKIGTSSGPDRDQRPKLFSGEIHPSEAHGSDGMLTNVGSMFSQCCFNVVVYEKKRNRSLSPPHHHQYFGAMPFYCPNIDPLNWVTIFVTTFFIELCYWARGFTRCWLFFSFSHASCSTRSTPSHALITSCWPISSSRDILNFAPKRVSPKHPLLTPSGSVVHPILIVRNDSRWRFFATNFVHVPHLVRCTNQLLYA